MIGVPRNMYCQFTIFFCYFRLNSSPCYTMEGPKYCSWDVKELANDYGWTELPTHPQDEDIMMSFYSDRHGGVKANVFMTTGTVATSLDHPTKGKTLLYRGKRNTFDQLEEVFDNPRVLTGSGYKTRAKLREEEIEMVNDQVNLPIGLGEDNEGNAVPYDLYEGLDDIENLRIEDSDSDVSGMTGDDLFLKRLEFKSVSDFDGESQIEKLLNQWDEEESESENEEESDEHLDDLEATSSNDESENEIEDYTENTEVSENDSDQPHFSSSTDSDSDNSESEIEGFGTETSNESEYTSEDFENDLDGF